MLLFACCCFGLLGWVFVLLLLDWCLGFGYCCNSVVCVLLVEFTHLLMLCCVWIDVYLIAILIVVFDWFMLLIRCVLVDVLVWLDCCLCFGLVLGIWWLFDLLWFSLLVWMFDWFVELWLFDGCLVVLDCLFGCFDLFSLAVGFVLLVLVLYWLIGFGLVFDFSLYLGCG